MKSSPDVYDALIIGAGAAGLAAATELAAAKKSVCLLEARDRIGGRISTRYEPDLAAPIELGAEFIHGESAAIIEWLNKNNTAMIDASQERWRMEAGRLRQGDDVFEEMKRGLKKVRKPRKDLPFSEFLDGAARGRLSPRAREFARMLVQGFDAADAARVSTLQILEEWSGDSAADAPTFRPLGGYGSLLQALQSGLDAQKVSLQLNAIVREVKWRRGEVAVRGQRQGIDFEYRAPAAIVTLPLGVMQLPPQAPGAVNFSPPLKTKQRALDGLASGPVIKVILRFRHAFWEKLDDARYRDAAFFHSPNAAFPTFWTSLPLRTPLLVAWTAGPSAARLAGLTETAIVNHALDSASSLFGKRIDIRAQWLAAYCHDWQADLFACGAYSYVTAGHEGARNALAAQVQSTLFFAGEATDVEAAATVGGALDSGSRAAKQLLAGPRAVRKRKS